MKRIPELTDDELKEIIFDLGGRAYLMEEESQLFTEAIEEADTRWRKEARKCQYSARTADTT